MADQPTLAEAEEAVRVALDRLRAVRTELGLHDLLRGNNAAHGGSVRNRSAICIGAAGGYGAKHSSCDGRYHGAPCTCTCHGARL